jgi:integrase/recombinase XerD
METKTIENTAEEFLLYLQVEKRFASSSIVSYRSRIKCFVRDVGNIPIEEFTMNHIFKLKQILFERNNSEVFISVCLACIKGLLRYYRDQYSATLQINPDLIKLPTRPRREVTYLQSEEIQRFRDAIDTRKIHGLRFRTLVETLLGSGMRISEALSLDRNSIDFTTKEAKVIGKGNKERTVFFSDDAIYWIRTYLEKRTDEHEALFVTSFSLKDAGVRRLRNQDSSKYFKTIRNKAGINKKVTPHCLRHCFASHLAFNNCPFTEIKTLCGHSRLETTIKYYIGLTDKLKAKTAQETYLHY